MVDTHQPNSLFISSFFSIFFLLFYSPLSPVLHCLRYSFFGFPLFASCNKKTSSTKTICAHCICAHNVLDFCRFQSICHIHTRVNAECNVHHKNRQWMWPVCTSDCHFPSAITILAIKWNTHVSFIRIFVFVVVPSSSEIQSIQILFCAPSFLFLSAIRSAILWANVSEDQRGMSQQVFTNSNKQKIVKRKNIYDMRVRTLRFSEQWISHVNGPDCTRKTTNATAPTPSHAIIKSIEIHYTIEIKTHVCGSGVCTVHVLCRVPCASCVCPLMLAFIWWLWMWIS